MRKIKILIMTALLGIASSGVFAQGYPVLDVANLMESIEAVYQYYQQIQNTIEQVQNTYKQIEQSAQNMMTMNWDDLKDLGKNFDGMGDNPFEVITGVRNSAQDITKAVNNNMNKINALQDSLNKESIEFGGQKVSVADLCGAGDDPGKNIFGFTKSCWEYTTDTENGAFSDAIKAWEGKLTYAQKQAIARKYGMSPRNYATLSYGNIMLDNLVQESGLWTTEAGQRKIFEDIEMDANAISMLAKQSPDGSTYAQCQLINSSLAQLDRNLGNLHSSLNRGIGLIGSKIKGDESKKAVAGQEKYEKSENAEKNTTSGSISRNDDI